MKIYKVKIRKELLTSVPEEERTFFFSIAHLANEINILLRFVLWSHRTPRENKAEANGGVTLTWMFIKLLAGKLNEGHILLQKWYFPRISRLYDASLRPEGKEALDRIKHYFGKSNALVHFIRNNFAFHYSPDEFNKVFPDIPEDFEFYVEKGGSANNLYYFSEALANRAILRNMGASDDYEAYKKLVVEIPNVANWFSTLCISLLDQFIVKYKNDIWDGEAEEICLENLPDMNDVQLPWFVNPTQIYHEFDGK